MAQNAIISIINEFKTNLQEDDMISLLGKTEFWNKIIPISSKEINMVAPNVLHSKLSENFALGLLGLKDIELIIEGDLIFENKGKDSQGDIIDFYIRDNNILEKLEGRIRLRKLPNGIKLGIFIYSLEVKKSQIVSGHAVELIMRSKLRELIEKIEEYIK